MAERTVINITDFGGLDETYTDSDVPQNRLRQALNVTKNSAGQLGKRYGFSALTTVANARKLAAYRNELLAADAVNLQAYSAGTWRVRGRIPAVIATQVPFETGASGSGMQADIVKGGGMLAVAWDTANNGTYAAVVDATTGSVISPLAQLNGFAYSPRLLYLNGVLLVIYSSGTGIVSRTFNTGSGTWNSPNLITAIPNTTIDACVITGTIFAAIVYGTSSNTVGVIRIDNTGTLLTGPVTVVSGLTLKPNVTCRSAIPNLWIAWSSLDVGSNTATTAYALLNSSTLASVLAPTTVQAVGSTYTSTVGIEQMSQTFALVTYSNSDVGMSWAVVNSSGTVIRTVTARYNWVLQSKPFLKLFNGVGRYYALALYQGAFQTTSVLVELDTDQSALTSGIEGFWPQATLNPRASVNVQTTVPFIPYDRINGIDVEGDSTQTAYQTLAPVFSSQGSTSLQVVSFDWNSTTACQSVQAGESTYFAGGVPFSYDGKRVYEDSMLHAPTATATGFSTGGLLQANSTYNYVLVYEQQNSRGETSYSPPNSFAPIVQVFGAIGGNTGRTVLSIATLRATYRSSSATTSPVNIAVYRTVWTGGAPSSVLYRIGSVANDPTVGFVTFTDDSALQMPDATAQTQRTLYTTGGVLESDAPPSLYFLCYHNQRLFGLAPDKRTIWYTTPVIGGEQPRWNDALTIPITGLGDLTAMASLDGRLVVFSATGMAFIFGDGPSDTGAGADFSLPQIQPFGVGCTDARSVCVMPLGVTFQSAKGLYLLSRAGEVSYLGARVQRTTALTPYCTSAVHVEKDAQVLFTFCSTLDNTGTGIVVCWDYRYDSFTLWTPYAGNAVSSFAPYLSSMSVAGTYYTLASSLVGGTDILFQDRTTYLDSGRWVQMTIQTPWIKTTELGWMRVNRLQVALNKGSAAGVSLECTRDYSTLSGDVTTFTEAQLTAATNPQFDVIPRNQQCEAFSLLLTDTAPATLGTGQGFWLGSVTFQVVVKGNEYKGLPASQKG